MKLLKYMAGFFVAVICIMSVTTPAFAQTSGKATSKNHAGMVKLLEASMMPGEGQKKLNAMVGTFDVKILSWVTPGSKPVESTASMVSAWVLDGRYVQSMLSGQASGTPFDGIGYIGYDNVAKIYQAAWMDSGSTGMVLYSGAMSASGKSAIMKARVPNPMTGKYSPVELRMTVQDNGGHVTELWGHGTGSQMFKMMELRYTKVK